MLGWDGLGVISFFLIVFYQSPTTVFSGWFTLLINRVGDCLLVIVIILF
jgi:NADH-ubiquinone oxidoreductase chain 5